MFEKKIYVPTTEKEFDFIVEEIMTRFKMTNKDHVRVVLANRIMHLPADQAVTTIKYLGHCVLKNMAYQVAQAQGSKVTHRLQVDQLMSLLKAEPNNAQARDGLEKAVKEGSDYAKTRLEEIDGPSLSIVSNEPGDTVADPVGGSA